MLILTLEPMRIFPKYLQQSLMRASTFTCGCGEIVLVPCHFLSNVVIFHHYRGTSSYLFSYSFHVEREIKKESDNASLCQQFCPANAIK